jgi:hypothetical protein
MGWEPNEDEMPKDPSVFSLEVQQALILFRALPDKWEGFSGTWMGKEYAGLMDIMNIYQIEDKKKVFELLKVAEHEAEKYYSQKKKEQESLAKAKAKKGR